MSVNLDLYQAFVGDAQRRFVAPPAIPYDVAANVGPDQREYELFKKIHSERLAGSGPWGLVSWKFEHKSLVSISQFYDYASERLATGDQCVFLNPMIGNAAIHTNVWEQWAVANRAIPHLCEFLGTVGDVSYAKPMGEESFAFCNYFVATAQFWSAYFDYVDRFIHRLEREKTADSPIGQFYAGTANYKRNRDLTTKPFIIERLLSSFLAGNHGFSCSAYPHEPETFFVKFGPRLGEALSHLAQLKREGLRGDPNTFFRWDQLRQRLMKEQMSAILQLDDPSELLLSEEFRPSLATPHPAVVEG